MLTVNILYFFRQCGASNYQKTCMYKVTYIKALVLLLFVFVFYICFMVQVQVFGKSSLRSFEHVSFAWDSQTMPHKTYHIWNVLLENTVLSYQRNVAKKYFLMFSVLIFRRKKARKLEERLYSSEEKSTLSFLTV